MAQMTGLNYKIQEMAHRIRELREIENYTIAEMAMKTGVTEQEYIDWVAGDVIRIYSKEADGSFDGIAPVTADNNNKYCADYKVSASTDAATTHQAPRVAIEPYTLDPYGTGSSEYGGLQWGTANKEHHLYPNIDNEKCGKCGKCVKICSESEYQALKRKENIIEVDKKVCEGCSLCSHVCPQNAITMIQEPDYSC